MGVGKADDRARPRYLSLATRNLLIFMHLQGNFVNSYSPGPVQGMHRAIYMLLLTWAEFPWDAGVLPQVVVGH